MGFTTAGPWQTPSNDSALVIEVYLNGRISSNDILTATSTRFGSASSSTSPELTMAPGLFSSRTKYGSGRGSSCVHGKTLVRAGFRTNWLMGPPAVTTLAGTRLECETRG